MLVAFAALRKAYEAVAREHRGCPGCDLCSQVADTVRMLEAVASSFADIVTPPDDEGLYRAYCETSERWAPAR
jgi:hypothetical protein